MISSYKLCYHGTIKQHGEYIEEHGIDLTRGRAATDFGTGFYVTNNLKQAEEWAGKKCKDYTDMNAGKECVPVVLSFVLNVTMKKSLEGKCFHEPDEEWAQFILENRNKGRLGKTNHDFDFVAGPLADGKIAALLNRFNRGAITFENFLEGVQPFSNNNTQLSLTKERALEYIKLVEVKEIGSS